MSTALSTLVQDVQAYVYGCPQPVIINALRLAAIDFCKKSEAWKYRPAAQNVVINVSHVVIPLPEDSEIHGYGDVKYNGGEITFLDWDTVTGYDPAFPSITGTPSNFTYQQDLGTLYMYPVPNESLAGSLLVMVILKPTITATTLDTVIATRYKEAIVSGAVQRLSMMDKMVWYDPKKALLHGKIFLAGVADAHSEAKTDFGAKMRRVAVRKFR
jgi:hypothetical protein